MVNSTKVELIMLDYAPDGLHKFAEVLEGGLDLCFKVSEVLPFGINRALTRALNDSSIGGDFCNCRMRW